MGDIADWLPTLPYTYQTGNVAALHAGADPAQAITDQAQIGFPWGHPHFDKQARSDGVWVVHGHRPVAAIEVKAGRIAINTQADITGILSAVRLAAGEIAAL